MMKSLLLQAVQGKVTAENHSWRSQRRAGIPGLGCQTSSDDGSARVGLVSEGYTSGAINIDEDPESLNSCFEHK